MAACAGDDFFVPYTSYDYGMHLCFSCITQQFNLSQFSLLYLISNRCCGQIFNVLTFPHRQCPYLDFERLLPWLHGDRHYLHGTQQGKLKKCANRVIVHISSSPNDNWVGRYSFTRVHIPLDSTIDFKRK